MNHYQKISMLILALASMIFLGILAGSPMLDLISGPTALTGDTQLSQAENTYISYEVFHPVTAYTEEYYSGDPDRARQTAYVVYDRERQIFVKIVTASHNTSELNRLLQKANESDEMNESSLEPVTITGTLMSVTDSDETEDILKAVSGSEFEGTEEMNRQALAQSQWYVLENASVQGIPRWEIRVCIVVMGWNLLFFLIALLQLLKKGASQDYINGNHGTSLGHFLKAQLSWLTPWCHKGSARRTQSAFLTLAGLIAAAFVLGTATGRSISETLTALVPLFLGIGEFYCYLLLVGSGAAFNPYRILNIYGKTLEGLYPLEPERETVIQELLEADDSWNVHEQGKENFCHAILGSRYWIVLRRLEGAPITFIDSSRLGKISSKTESGQIRTGKVRYNYVVHSILLYYQGDEEKKQPTIQFGWDSETAAGCFLNLARKRLGGRAQTIMH